MKVKTVNRIIWLMKYWPFNKLLAGVLARQFKKKVGGEKNMKKIIEYLNGKKSFVVIAIGMIAGFIQFKYDVEVPAEVWTTILGALGLTIKDGWNRSEKATVELLNEIKKAQK